MPEITTAVSLTPEQHAQMELHSFLNVATILGEEVEMLRMDIGGAGALCETSDNASNLQAIVAAGDIDQLLKVDPATLSARFEDELTLAWEVNPDLKDIPELAEVADNIRSLLQVFVVRLDELRERNRVGAVWIDHSIEGLYRNFDVWFRALVKNSKDSYQIATNIADKKHSDYFIALQIDSPDGHTINMPPVLQDVFRDLIANARKYTPPGGEIRAGMRDDGEEIRIVVEDTGRGIPQDELHRVVEFGYRGSNAGTRPTKGAGFGLTKAYVTARALDGRMFIRSELLKGTRIKVTIPRPGAASGD